MTVRYTPEELQDQALVPDGVVSRGEVHQYNARLVVFFELSSLSFVSFTISWTVLRPRRKPACWLGSWGSTMGSKRVRRSRSRTLNGTQRIEIGR